MYVTERALLSENADTHILFIGRPEGAVADTSQLQRPQITQIDSMMEAVAESAKTGFDIIYIVMSNCGPRLMGALEALRKVCRDCRIVLLAEMYEEPLAREILNYHSEEGSLADDYHICPFDIGEIFVRTVEQRARGDQSGGVHEPGGYKPDWKDKRIRELEKLATEDDLTGLKNRRYVREFLTQVIERSQIEDLRVTLLVFDIDNFKHYNDTYGHTVGDNVLKQVAVMMRRCCRGHDIIGRIGGDEFAVIFWDLPGEYRKKVFSPKGGSERRHTNVEHPRDAIFIAERFRKELSSAELSFLGPSGKGVLTISGGLASFPRDGKGVAELFEQADIAMLQAKRKGKNQIFIVGIPGGNTEKH